MVGVTAAAAQTYPYTLQWKRLAGSPAPARVVESGELTIYAEADGAVLAVNRADGLRRWRRRPGGPVGAGLAVAGGRVLVADRWGGVWALGRDTGNVLWTFRRSGRGAAYLRVVDDGLLVAGGGGVLYRLDLETGEETWRVRTAQRPRAAPAVSQGRVYVVTADRELLALETTSGRRLAARTLPERMQHVQAKRPNGVYVAGAGEVACFDANLRPRWRRWLGTDLTVSPLAAAEQLLVSGRNGYLYALDTRTGSTRWKRDLAACLDGEPVVAAGQGIVAVTDSGALLGLTVTGDVAWRRQLAADPAARVQAGGHGRLYLSTGSHLHAFDPAPVGDSGDTLWWEATSDGVKSGYGWQLWTASARALELDSYAVGWRSGFVRLRARLELDPVSLAPRRLERRRVEGSQALETSLVAVGDSLRVQRRLGQSAESRSVPLPPGATVVEALPRWLQRRALEPGARDTVLIVDPEHGGTRPLAVQAEGVDPATGQRRYRLRYGSPVGPAPPPAAVLPVDLLPRVELLLWLDGAGLEARTEAPLLGSAERQVSAREARDWTPVVPSAGVRLEAPVEAPDRLDSLVLQLPASLGPVASLFVLDRRQALVTDSLGTRLTVRRQAPPASPLALRRLARPELAPYLAPSLYVQADAEPIRQLAARIVPDANAVDSWQATAAILHWVYDHMTPAETNVRFKSSLEVLDDLEGTCSEYTVLFAALARAVGIPTRVSVGYAVAADGSLVLHIWPQVYVGEWVEVDPSWNALPVPASHLKTGQGLLRPEHLQRLNLPLEWIGAHADTLGLLAYGGGGAPYVARAESLYAAADAAERDFDAPAALAARYELAAMPWNRRSGAALIDIARHHLDRQEWDDAEWALDRIGRLDPEGPFADDAMHYRARLEAGRGQPAKARQLLEELLRRHPDGDHADDALAALADMVAKAEGCRRARPYYERLTEVYAESGWASVAAAALRRCGEQERLLRESPPAP